MVEHIDSLKEDLSVMFINPRHSSTKNLLFSLKSNLPKSRRVTSARIGQSAEDNCQTIIEANFNTWRQFFLEALEIPTIFMAQSNIYYWDVFRTKDIHI
jgi:hypothetical protein